MKNLVQLFAFMLVTAIASAGTVTVTWDYDFTNSKICSATVVTDCLDHFELGWVAGTTFQSRAVVPITGTPTGPVTGLTGTFIDNMNLGPDKVLTVVMYGKFGAGKTVIGSDWTKCPPALKCTATLPLNFPSNPTNQSAQDDW